MKTHIGVLVQHPTQSHLINNLCVRLGAGGNNTTVVAAKNNQKLLDKPDSICKDYPQPPPCPNLQTADPIKVSRNLPDTQFTLVNEEVKTWFNTLSY